MPTERSPLGARAQKACPHSCRAFAWVLILSLLPALTSALAQEGNQGSNPAGGSEPEHREDAYGTRQRPWPGGRGIFRRLRELTPIEQRRAMANNPQFRQMSPDRRELIRERLRQWNAMSPQEKERVRQREEILQGLSPAQRQEARNIFPQWRDLTSARRQAVMVAFRHLRDIPPDQRRAFLDSQQVREQFSPHERDILEGLNKLLPVSRTPEPSDPDP